MQKKKKNEAEVRAELQKLGFTNAVIDEVVNAHEKDLFEIGPSIDLAERIAERTAPLLRK